MQHVPDRFGTPPRALTFETCRSYSSTTESRPTIFRPASATCSTIWPTDGWVIVILNAETIWNRPGNRNAANHFVVVTGIDPGQGVVHLNDSGIRNGQDEQVPIATFKRAWAPNHNSAVVTR